MATESVPLEPIQKRQKICKQELYDEVDLSTWRNGYVSSKNNFKCCNNSDIPQSSSTRLPLVDLRSKEAYSTNHLFDVCPSSLIVHLPFEDLLSGERSCELPPRHVEFAILVPFNLDQTQVDELFFATSSKATSQSRKPWLVRQIVRETDKLWNDARDIGIFGSSKEGGDVGLKPLPRLWKPDQMVEEALLPLLLKKIDSSSEDDIIVWDLGSGAGRDVAFLAEELKHEIQKTKSRQKLRIVGFDNHKGSARRSSPLWKNRLVEDVTGSRLVNLKNISLLENHIREANGLVCLYAIRYLNRRMLDFIASSDALGTGCIFAMSHFCKEDAGLWTFDHPKVRSISNICCIINWME